MIRAIGLFLFMLLKLIGWLLLVLVLVLAVCLLLVILVPVRYRVEAQNRNETEPSARNGFRNSLKNLSIQVKFTWLLHLIHITVSYDHEKFRNSIRMAGVDVLGLSARFRQRRKACKKRSKKKKGNINQRDHKSEQDIKSTTNPEGQALKDNYSEENYMGETYSEDNVNDHDTKEGYSEDNYANDQHVKNNYSEGNVNDHHIKDNYSEDNVKDQHVEDNYSEGNANSHHREEGDSKDNYVNSNYVEDNYPEDNYVNDNYVNDHHIEEADSKSIPLKDNHLTNRRIKDNHLKKAKDLTEKSSESAKDTGSNKKAASGATSGKNKAVTGTADRKNKAASETANRKNKAASETADRKNKAASKTADRKNKVTAGIASGKSKAAQLHQEFTDETNRNAARHVWKEICYLFTHYNPRKLKADIDFSLADPALTGEVTGLISLQPFIYRYPCSIIPDFESDAIYIEGSLMIQGRVSVGVFLISLLRLFRDKEVMYCVRRLMGRNR